MVSARPMHKAEATDLEESRSEKCDNDGFGSIGVMISIATSPIFMVSHQGWMRRKKVQVGGKDSLVILSFIHLKERR